MKNYKQLVLIILVVLELLLGIGRTEEVKVDLSLEYVKVMKEKIKKVEFLVSNHIMEPLPYRRMQIMHDLKGYPEYVTNGEGPQYTKEQVEGLKKENKWKEPDFMPNMPEKMPDILLQQQQHLLRIKGIPVPQPSIWDPDVHWNETTKAQLTLLEQQHGSKTRVLNDMPRFIETHQQLSQKEQGQVKSKESEQNRQKIFLAWAPAVFRSAWASSVWSFRFLWWHISYRAEYAIYPWFYWCSAGFHGKDDIVTWQGDMIENQRINHVWIFWAFSAGKHKLQTTDDSKSWKDQGDWIDHIFNNWFTGFFKFHWRWWFRSYAENIDFDDPQLFKGVRILMKDPINYFYGIYNVIVWVKQWNVMMISGDQSDGDMCLVTQNGKYSNGQKIFAMPCAEAIAPADHREIFVIQVNSQITSYVGGKCIETSYGDTSDHAVLQLYTCIASMLMFDNREKFELDIKNKLRLKKNRNKCMFYLDQNYEAQQQCDTQVWASSETADCQHAPKLMIDGDNDSYWQTQPGVDHAIIKISFQEETVKEIEIEFQNMPKKYELNIYYQGYWKSLGVKGVNEKKVKVAVGLKSLSGLKIVLQGAKDTVDTANGAFPIIGIKHVKLITGYKKVGVRDCDATEGNGKWFFQDVYWASNWHKLVYGWTLSVLYQSVNALTVVIRIVIRIPYYIVKMIGVASTLQDRIDHLENELSLVDVNLMQLQNSKQFDVEDILTWKKYLSVATVKFIQFGGKSGKDDKKETKKKDKQQGSTSKTPANQCYSIKKKFPYKRSGYYWIKPNCVPNPLRVFCDYDIHPFGRDMAYYGNTKGSQKELDIKTRKDAIKECANLGLQYFEFSAKEDEFLAVKDYLFDIGVDFGGQKMTPLFFDWTCEWWCLDVFKSLSSSKSPVCEYANANIDAENIFNQAWAMVFGAKSKDALGLGNSSKGKLVKFALGGKEKVGGVVCSTNPPKEGPKAPSGEIGCSDVVKGNPNIALLPMAQSTVTCPAGCLKDQTEVIGSGGKYSDQSSICKAAIHAGVFDEKGGTCIVQIGLGIFIGQTYAASEANGVTSETADGPNPISFNILPVPPVPCPSDEFDKQEKSLLKKALGFLQLDSKVTYKDKAKIDKKSKGATKDKTQFSEDIGKQMDELFKEEDFQRKIDTNAPDEEFGFTNFLQTESSVQNKISSDSRKEGGVTDKVTDAITAKQSQEKEEDKDKEDEEDKVTSSQFDKVKGFLAFDEQEMSKDVHLAEDAVKLLNDITGQLGPLMYAPIAPMKQLQRIAGQIKHLWGSYWEMFKVMNIGKNRIKQLFAIKWKYMQLLNFGNLFADFAMVATGAIKLEENWDIFNLKKAQNQPSKWQLATDNLNGHLGGITDLSEAYAGQGMTNGEVGVKQFGINFATHLILKGRAYYDANLFFSFQAVDNKQFAIAFRYMDPFNYYCVEFRKTEDKVIGYKRFAKVVQGYYEILGEVRDGGFNAMEWYNVAVILVGSKFELRFQQEKGKPFDYAYQSMEVKLDAMDSKFSQGTVAILNNGNQGIIFDNIKFTGSECKMNTIDPGKITYDGPECFRYNEKCFGEFPYKQYDHDECKQQGVWKCQKNFDGTFGGIKQSEKPKSDFETQLPSIISHSQSKPMEEGTIWLEFKAKEAGYIGIGFHYHTSQNHYAFEIFPKKCRLRQASPGGKYKVILEVAETCGYKAGKWTQLVLRRKGQKLLVYMSKEDKKTLELVIENDVQWGLSKGTFALMAMNTPVEYSKIRVMPNPDFDEIMTLEEGTLANGAGGAGGAEGSGGDKDGGGNGGKNKKRKRNKKKKKKKDGDKEEEEEEEDLPNEQMNNQLKLPGEKKKETTCLDFHEKKQKLQFCNQKYQGNSKSVGYCMSHYCTACCVELFPGDKTQKKECESDCNSSMVPQKSEVYKYCIDSPQLQDSIYPVCSKLNKEEPDIQAQRCQTRMCQSCCTMDMKNEDVFECLTECEDRYFVTPLANSKKQ